MKVISAETQKPIAGATFSLLPYRSMFRKGSLKPNERLGESDRSDEFHFKLNTKEGILVQAQGFKDASLGYVENGVIGLSSPWTPSEWKGAYPTPKKFDRKQQIVIPLIPNPIK